MSWLWPKFGQVEAAKKRGVAEALHGNRGASRRWLAACLIAIGTWSLMAGALISQIPTGTAHLAIAAGAALLAVAGVLVLAPWRDGRAVGEFDRFNAIGDRLEQGIEKLKDLQWEISDNEARYRDLLDSQPDVISRTDAEGRLTFVNRAFCRAFGVEARAVLGSKFDFEVLETDEATRETSRDCRRKRVEQLVVTTDGSRWLSFEQRAILGEDSRLIELQSIGRDVTQERRALANLREARDQADAANKAKSRFLAAMSHEIRTPMNGILGMASLLGETALSSEQESYLSAIDRSAKTLLNIIDEILDLSKIEAGKLEIHPAPFPLDECVQNVIELIGTRAREKSLDLAWRIDPDLPKIVIGDETRVRQILLNLVGNAVKFTDAGGVSVRVRRAYGAHGPGSQATGDRAIVIALEVADTGSGIQPERAKKLFSEFEQADDVIKRKQIGSGLGLAISQRLAQAMGGDIEFESTPGQGSTFRARLRLEAQAGSRNVLAATRAATGRRVLVASERPQSRSMIQEILASVGVAAVASDLAGAERACQEAARQGAAFDTVVGDAGFGADEIARLTGCVATLLGSRPRTILLVDQPGDARNEGFRRAGCDAYLVRPARPSSIITQMEANAGPGQDAVRVDDRTIASPEACREVRRQILLVEDNDINALLARRMGEKAGCTV
ncbi:MAG: PAS domain S-box protein, partial [Proteobacteria bacterium]|nr:PAS domain S-box protein [Pseudomonadota bacterium]